MPLTAAQLAAIKASTATLTSQVNAMVADTGAPPPPPTDTTADAGGDLKIVVAPPVPGLVVNYTVSGLDSDAVATVTFKDKDGKTLIVTVPTNGARSAALTGFAYGALTATIGARDVVNNIANGTGATATLTAPPVTPPPPPPVAGTAAGLLGPFNKSSDAIAMGGPFAVYESRFVTWAERHWAGYGPRWEGNGGAGYDLSKVYAIWHERTGNPVYLARSTALALDYRDRHCLSGVKAPGINPLGWQGSPEWWGQYLGLMLLQKRTPDAKTLGCIGHNADLQAYDVVDRRQTAKITGSWNAGRPLYQAFNGLLAAHVNNALSIGAPSDTSPTGKAAGGHNWRACLDQLITDLITTQNAAGYWRFAGQSGQIWFYPYQMGLIMDCLVTYWHLVAQDPRIPTAIKKCCDYLWSTRHQPTNTFWYVLESNPVEGEIKQPGPAGAELTAMALNGIGFVYHYTGDAAYKAMGDAIMVAIMAGDGSNTPPGAYLDGYKQFQETYAFSYRYSHYRSIAPLNKPA